MHINDDDSPDGVLQPIPANFVDMAIAGIRRKSAETPSPQQAVPPTPMQTRSVTPESNNSVQSTQNTRSEIAYFKGADGSEYRMKDGKLYVKGWKDAECSVRVISEKTGKEIPLNGKKVQMFGWNPIETADESDIEECPEADSSEED